MKLTLNVSRIILTIFRSKRKLNPNRISKISGSCFAGLIPISDKLEVLGFLVREKIDNRSSSRILTDKGVKLAKALSEIEDLGFDLILK